jgi:hypothetical protein
MRSTGGLRPPLLVQSERLPAKNDFCDAETHVHESGGRQPAVVRDGPRLQRTPTDVWRRTTAEPRAAGVSPPWFGKGPRLQGEANNVRRTRTAESRAAGVSPPWVLGKRTCKSASAKSRGTAGSVLTNAGGVTAANPRGAYAPAPGAERRFAGEKRFLRCTNARSQERRASARRGRE